MGNLLTSRENSKFARTAVPCVGTRGGAVGWGTDHKQKVAISIPDGVFAIFH